MGPFGDVPVRAEAWRVGQKVFCDTRPSLKRPSERKHAKYDECEDLHGEHDAVSLV